MLRKREAYRSKIKKIAEIGCHFNPLLSLVKAYFATHVTQTKRENTNKRLT